MKVILAVVIIVLALNLFTIHLDNRTGYVPPPPVPSPQQLETRGEDEASWMFPVLAVGSVLLFCGAVDNNQKENHW